MGCSWVPLGRSWVPLGSPWALLGALGRSWMPLGCSRVPLGCSLVPLWALLGSPWPLLGALGRPRDALGYPSGALWWPLGFGSWVQFSMATACPKRFQFLFAEICSHSLFVYELLAPFLLTCACLFFLSVSNLAFRKELCINGRTKYVLYICCRGFVCSLTF